MDDLLGSLQSMKIMAFNHSKFKQLTNLHTKKRQKIVNHIFPFLVTFAGSKLTRPQARATTPLQFYEMAKMPTESRPG